MYEFSLRNCPVFFHSVCVTDKMCFAIIPGRFSPVVSHINKQLYSTKDLNCKLYFISLSSCELCPV